MSFINSVIKLFSKMAYYLSGLNDVMAVKRHMYFLSFVEKYDESGKEKVRVINWNYHY